MSDRPKVFVTSCESGEGAWTTHEKKLLRLYELSDKRYALTDDPDLADVILVGNVREEDWGARILSQELINTYPDKSFSLSDRDIPLMLHHGLYTSPPRSIAAWGRVRTGCYTLFPDEYLNPYVRSHVLDADQSIAKSYLMAFVGRNCHRCRDELLNLDFVRPDIYLEDTSSFNLWAVPPPEDTAARQLHYYAVLLQSKFSLCPRGYGTNSVRLFESMQMGIAPVIISDAWIPPAGPNWSEFAVFVKERHVRNVERVVEAHESDYQEMGRLAREAYDRYFGDDVYFNYVVDACLDIGSEQRIPEALYWNCNGLLVRMLRLRHGIRLRSRIRGLLQGSR